MNEQEWWERARKLMPVLIAKGTAEMHERNELFLLYNERRFIITGAEVKRETGTHCSGCVSRVFSRMKKYYESF